MGIVNINGVAKVHEERRALPGEAGFYVRVEEVGLVEEVGYCDSDGVGWPQFEAGILFGNVEDHRVVVLCMGRHHGCGDVLLFTPGMLEDTKGFGWLCSHADGTEVDAEGSLDSTVVWVLVISGEVNLLPIFIVLLLSPLES